MTRHEFDNINWGANMKAIYAGNIYLISSVNFKERLLGLLDNDDGLMWVRCENINLVS